MCKTWATNLLLLLRMVMSMLRHQKAFRGLREGSVVFTILRYKNWYYVYDEAGKKIGGLSRSSVGDLKGWGSDFFVIILHIVPDPVCSKYLRYSADY